MNLLRFTALLGLSIAGGLACASFGSPALRAEENVWPFYVAQTDDHGGVRSWQAAGPLIFRKPATEPGTVAGFRPLFAQWRNLDGSVRETNFLYPLFTYRTDGGTYRWSVLQLINRTGDRATRAAERAPALTYETFDLWPFWFSRKTGGDQGSYDALFPLGGTIKSRFGYDRLSFALFPLYGRAEKKGAITIASPWPFIKTTYGTEQGFAFWPLFGRREKAGAFDHQFYLWPLGWNNTDQPGEDAPAGSMARRAVGFLPFYTRETATGFVNENVLWPFFGYTDRTQPLRYHETRYFWPLLVQGHGDDQEVERFGPFYTHSIRKGVEKTWVLWPLYREKNWADTGVQQTQRQFLYFLYRSTEQRSATNPQAAPAEKFHVWPLISVWDNGAGRKQVQFPSPLEVFFPDNERIRVSWSPLFSLYRFDQRAPGDESREFLWGLLSWHHAPAEREFHLGPLFSVHERNGEKRVAVGNGLIAWQRSSPTQRWRLFWFDFQAKANNLGASSR